MHKPVTEKEQMKLAMAAKMTSDAGTLSMGPVR
jgi:hypothetical protein